MRRRNAPMTTPIAVAGSPTSPTGLNLSPPTTYLHGLVAIPTSFTWDGERYTGPRLASLELDRAKNLPGVVDVVVCESFVGVLAIQRAQAALALAELRLQWDEGIVNAADTLAPKNDSTGGHSNTPTTAPAPPRTYRWAPAAADEIAATSAIADYQPDKLTIWAACEPTQELRAELALLSGLPIEAVAVVKMTEGGAAAYDLAIEAALLSRHAGRPVKAYAHYPEATPPLAVSLRPSTTGITAHRSYHLHARPSKAALLCGMSVTPSLSEQLSTFPGFQSGPSAQYAPVGNFPGEATLEAEVFAESSYWDEEARHRGADPLETRLKQLDNVRAREMIKRVATQADWPRAKTSTDETYYGRGFAYAQTLDDALTPPRTTMSAWIVDVSIDKSSGQITIDRLTVGNDSSEAAGAKPMPISLETGIRDTVGELLLPSTRFDDWVARADADMQSTALNKTQVDIVSSMNNVQVTVGWNRVTTLPAAAAIANAIHDATGIRLREVPFGDKVPQLSTLKPRRAGRLRAVLAGGVAAITGVIATIWPWPQPLAPIANVDTSIYSLATIERGRRIASAGDCMVCHTAEGGVENAGGLPLPTPFGTIYTTNITPDKETGIGTWSFEAFDRAMRQGIHQDGTHLYPAFPYTAFSKMSDGDMQSLYAYLMTRPAAKSETRKNEMSFPFNVRKLLAGWNVLYNRSEQFSPDPEQSTLWNRGAYLVEAVGHCAACHSPHNALGGQKKDWLSYLSGAFVKGWEAPALNHMTHSPNPWTEADFYEYLRTGYSARHGVASGPMAPVVQGLQELDDQDIRAIAHYLGDLPAPAPTTQTPTTPPEQEVVNSTDGNTISLQLLAGENVFRGACAACHDASEGPALFGARPLLSVNTNVHSSSPDNLIRTILYGIRKPADSSLGFMPGFKGSLNEIQLANLLRYLRHQFAPDKKTWTGLEDRISKLLAETPY